MVTTQAKQITEQIYDYLADVGPGLDTRNEKSFRPQLADRWNWSTDSLMLFFHINPEAKWHDGKDVTAKDVQFTFNLNKNPAVGSRVESDLANIDSVTVADSLTPVFWFHRRSPTQFLDAAAQMLILPAHQLERIPLTRLRESAPSPIGSGRFRLGRWDKGSSVQIVSDTSNYRGRAKLDRVIWSVSLDVTAAVTTLLSGSTDMFDGLRPENLSDIARRKNLRTIMLPGMEFACLRFNLRDPTNPNRPHPFFGDRGVRRAIAMSLDRRALARSVLDTFAIVPAGPTVSGYPTTDPRGSQIPFDSARASALLDSLGWRRPFLDGFREKNGRQMAFTITLPGLSKNRVRMSVLIQEELRRMGIRANLEPLEQSAVTAKEVSGNFDASLDGLVMASSPDGIRDVWGTRGIGKNGANYGGYSNPKFDALLDSALNANPAHAREIFTRAYSVINDDAPAVWLYEPRKIIGIQKRIRTAKMRPDAWWFDLADWYIPSGERIQRDLIPASH